MAVLCAESLAPKLQRWFFLVQVVAQTMTLACGRTNAQIYRGSCKRDSCTKRPGTSRSTIFNVWTATDNEKPQEHKQIILRAEVLEPGRTTTLIKDGFHLLEEFSSGASIP